MNNIQYNIRANPDSFPVAHSNWYPPVAVLEKNQQYAALTEQRTNAQADNPVESAKKIRLRMDEEYDEMTTYAFAQSVVKPTATTATFINRLNTLIDETNALYNQRIAQAPPRKRRQEASG